MMSEELIKINGEHTESRPYFAIILFNLQDALEKVNCLLWT